MPGLDALRSASMVAVVVAHAATAYVSRPIPVVPWAVYDRSRSFAFDLIVWSTISWAMPAFFALGGFAASAIWSSRGPRGFVRDRLRRIAAPTIVFSPLVLLPTLAVWACGWFVSGRATLRQSLNLVFADPEIRANLYGPAHLWFLEYLLLMLAAYVVVRLPMRRAAGRMPGWAFSWLGPFLLAVPTALLLRLGHAADGLDPILDLRNSFAPNPVRWLHHAWFFAVGAWLFGSRAELPRLSRHAAGFLTMAAAAFAVRASMLRFDLGASLDGPSAWLSDGSAALFGWLALFGSIGLFLRFDRPAPAVRYLAAGSYWIYLTHFPIVGLAQVGLYPLPWPAPAKFLIALGATLGFGLLSYHGLARATAIGRLLNGSKPKPTAVAPPAPSLIWRASVLRPDEAADIACPCEILSTSMVSSSLPTDLAANHDHDLHGLPKRP